MQLKYTMLFIYFCILQNISCQQLESVKDEREVYSLIIDRMAQPLPPPPPPAEGGLKSVPKRVVDSIKNIKLNLAIMVYSQGSKQQIQKNNIDILYHKIIDEHIETNENDFKITSKMIHSNIGHKTTILKNNEIKDKKQLFKKFDQLIYLSNIVFNIDKDKGVVYVGRAVSEKLSGTSFLFLIKKEKEKWVVEMIKELSIS